MVNRILQPRKFRLLYLLAFMGSLDFHLEMLYPIRYQYDKDLPLIAERENPMGQLITLLRKVVLNLPILSEGERQELYLVVGEDVRRHYEGLSFEDNKEYIAMAVKVLEAALNRANDKDILRLAQDIAAQIAGKPL